MSSKKTPVDPASIRSPITLDDLAADLLWPRLLRAPIMALRPSRLGICFFLIIIAAVVLAFCGWIESALGWQGGDEALHRFEAVRAMLKSGAQLRDPAAAPMLVIRALGELPNAAFDAHPVGSTVGALCVLVAWCLAFGAVARSAACEVAGVRSPSWPELIAFAVGKWMSLVGAVVLPLVLVAVMSFGISLAGVVLRLPFLNLLGSVLFGLLLMVGIACIFLLGVYMLGHWMFVPAIASEGSDGIDAVQRSYSYALGKPFRLIIYTTILFVQGLVVGSIVLSLTGTAVAYSTQAAARWAGPDARTMLEQAYAGAIGGDKAEEAVLRAATTTQMIELERVPEKDQEPTLDRNFSFAWGARVVQLWMLVPLTLGWAYVLSYIMCGSSVMYLLMRRVNDGQDVAEIWQARPIAGPDPAMESPVAAPEAEGDAD